MVCMLASRTCNRGFRCVAVRHQIASSGPPYTPPGGAAIDLAAAGYLLGGRLGVRLGDRLNGSVILFIGIGALLQ